MKYQLEAGSTIVLLQCRAWTQTDGAPEETTLTGLFNLEEWCPVDRAAYCHEAGWLVASPDDNEAMWFVAWDDLHPQVSPSSYARELVQERDQANHEEVYA